MKPILVIFDGCFNPCSSFVRWFVQKLEFPFEFILLLRCVVLGTDSTGFVVYVVDSDACLVQCALGDYTQIVCRIFVDNDGDPLRSP